MLISESKIAAGRDLILALDQTDAAVLAAFWFRWPTDFEFNLGICPKKALSKKSFYSKAQRTLKAESSNCIALSEIVMFRRQDQLIALLGVVLKTGKEHMGAVTLVGCSVNGVSLPDMFVYRSA